MKEPHEYIFEYTQDRKPKPAVIVFGESHAILPEQSRFRSVVSDALLPLYQLGYTNLYIELNREGQNDLLNYFSGAMELGGYREKWMTENFASLIPNAFMESAKQFANAGGAVALVNKRDDPGRDQAIAEPIIAAVRAGAKCILWCGLAHAGIRRARERKVWTSSAELMENACGKGTVFGIAEASWACIYNGYRYYDERLEAGLNMIENKNALSVVRVEDFKTVIPLDTVLMRSRIGKDTTILTEFEPETLVLRVHDFSALVFDNRKFISDRETALEYKGVPWNFEHEIDDDDDLR